MRDRAGLATARKGEPRRTYTRKIRDDRDTELLEKTSLPDARALEDLRSAESST